MWQFFGAVCLLGGVTTSVAWDATAAHASGNVKPTLTATQAAFAIPPTSNGVWTLKLWTMPGSTTLMGETSGTSGTLTLPVPQTRNCEFQVDVRFARVGSPVSFFYSGLIATVPGCGQSGGGPRLTPGYWKTHPDVTQTFLPQSLGAYQVTTSVESTAIFDAMKCSDAVDCLAGHLLAAELDMANGSSICISGVVFHANQFLDGVGYAGPGSYTIDQAQRDRALHFETELDAYTNDSNTTSCG